MRIGAIACVLTVGLSASRCGVPPERGRAAVSEIERLRLSCDEGRVSDCLASGRLGRAARIELKDAGLADRLDRATTPLGTSAALAEYSLSVRQRKLEAGIGMPEHVYLWSRRLLRSRLALGPDRKARALDAHATAMRQLERTVVRLVGPAAPPPAEAGFFRAEAECDAKQGRQGVHDAMRCRQLVLSSARESYSLQSAAYLRTIGSGDAGREVDWLIAGPELACRWSERWLRSEIAMDSARRASALAAHLARLGILERQTRKSVENGTVAPASLARIHAHLGEASPSGPGEIPGWAVAARNTAVQLAGHRTGTPEDAYVLSLCVLEATLAARPDRRSEAFAAHAASMTALRDSTLRRVAVGSAGTDAGVAALYFASEAAAWLDRPPDAVEPE